MYDGDSCVVNFPSSVTAHTGRAMTPDPPSQMRSMGWYSLLASSGARSIISSWMETADATRLAPPTEAVRTPSREITSHLRKGAA
jgi:hypothetical protein